MGAKRQRLNPYQRSIMMIVDGVIKRAINGVQIGIFDLTHITKAGEGAVQKYLDGKVFVSFEVLEREVKAAVDEAVRKYRKN